MPLILQQHARFTRDAALRLMLYREYRFRHFRRCRRPHAPCYYASAPGSHRPAYTLATSPAYAHARARAAFRRATMGAVDDIVRGR